MASPARKGFSMRFPVKQSKEYNHAYNSGFYAGQEQARAAMEQNADDVASFALAELQLILEHAQGYLRVGRGREGLVWCRFKWTDGEHAGCYTFGSDTTVGAAIAQVCSRIHEVESGKRKPTPDTGYSRR